jgi:DNA-binding transcriptional LysR family regulator
MLNLRQLEVFRAVMVAGSFTGAGRDLQMSQPAVSKAVKRMEDQLGFQLFRRAEGRIQATQEASSLFREVDKIFHTVNVVEKYARDMRDAQSGVLTLACTPTMSCSFVSQAIAQFRAGRPKVRVWLQITTTKEVMELAANGQVDIGLVYAPAEHPAVSTVPLFHSELVCVMAVDHPLAQRQVVRSSDLKDQPIITNVRNEPLHELLGSVFGGADLAPQVMIGTNSTITACSLVQAGCGIAIVEPMGIADLFPKTVQRRLQPPVPITPRAVHSSRTPLSRIGSNFLSVLREIITHTGNDLPGYEEAH